MNQETRLSTQRLRFLFLLSLLMASASIQPALGAQSQNPFTAAREALKKVMEQAKQPAQGEPASAPEPAQSAASGESELRQWRQPIERAQQTRGFEVHERAQHLPGPPHDASQSAAVLPQRSRGAGWWADSRALRSAARRECHGRHASIASRGRPQAGSAGKRARADQPAQTLRRAS
jgi:hypothetical protein